MANKKLKLISAMIAIGALFALSSCANSVQGAEKPTEQIATKSEEPVTETAQTTQTIAAANVDSVSAASIVNYYEAASITKEEFMAELAAEKRKGNSTVATTNPDGSPNLAVVIPGVADENTLVFGLADNQTKTNFIERKIAVISYYIYNPEAAEKNDRNRGCRVVVKLVEDESTLAKLNEGKEKPENNTYLEIVKVLPIG